MTANEIKQNIAEKTNCAMECINCGNCEHWGYNNGKPMNSMGDSYCKHLKRKTFKLQFCKSFAENA